MAFVPVDDDDDDDDALVVDDDDVVTDGVILFVERPLITLRVEEPILEDALLFLYVLPIKAPVVNVLSECNIVFFFGGGGISTNYVPSLGIAGVNASFERGALGGLDIILDVVLDEDRFDDLDVDDKIGGRDDVVVIVLISETDGVAAELFFSDTIVAVVAFASIDCFCTTDSVDASKVKDLSEIFFSTTAGAAEVVVVGTVSDKEEDFSGSLISGTSIVAIVCDDVDSSMLEIFFSSVFLSSSTSILSSF